MQFSYNLSQFWSKIFWLCLISDPRQDPLLQECFKHLTSDVFTLRCNTTLIHFVPLQQSETRFHSFVPSLSQSCAMMISSKAGPVSQWNIFHFSQDIPMTHSVKHCVNSCSIKAFADRSICQWDGWRLWVTTYLDFAFSQRWKRILNSFNW